MLATTQPEDIPQTIRSRCQHFSFRAVKFDDIVAQLRDLVTREKIEADDDALALLAEAGDGSMRDALSILDQAIASSTGRLTADSVRNLVGAAPAHILEQVMQGVSESKSVEILRLVDRLVSEGHSPTHFARQMVRFLRNATVAKVAGKDSALLQISSEERERVARVAELFSEEDITRHLQIMLRTHGELGYKQEQRFHLELGLLKMSHAQKLLPIEQLLSEVSGTPTTSQQRPPAKPSIVGSQPSSGARTDQSGRPNYVSPFAADSARKGTPRQEDSGPTLPPPSPRIMGQGTRPEPVIMGSAAPAPAPEPPQTFLKPQAANGPEIPRAALEQSPQPTSDSLAPVTESSPDSVERVQNAVLQALSDSGQNFLVSLLSSGEWSVQGNELIIKIAESQTVLDMSLGNDAKRLAIASASGVLGRAVKLRVISGAAVAAQQKRNGGVAPSSGVGGRGRAEQDPVVRRMQEKFGAEIRTVIDYRDKR